MTNSEKELMKKVTSSDKTESVQTLKYIFGYDSNHMPNVTNGELLYCAWEKAKSLSDEFEKELLFERFYKNSEERYQEFIAKNMKEIKSTTFDMGSKKDAKIRYCGEEPLHKVTLDTFLISDIVITQEIYAKYNPQHQNEVEKGKPVCNVTWYDAFMFCKWIGCRLPSEAEWEWASRGNNLDSYWCCNAESELESYAWYSENSKGIIRTVAQLQPNLFGLYDMHGNVWEWCMDSYDANYYAMSPVKNPINLKRGIKKVCRGGSINAFSEMCRCNFRNYENSDLSANDIGFRLARNM